MSYAEWALRAFRDRTARVLAAGGGDPDAAWLATCGPGDGAMRYRLYPGSLYLLWVEALGMDASEDDLRVAAALECLHNASLHHDDVLDQHDSRRGVATLPQSAALLAGDGLAGIAFRLLTADRRPCAPAVLERLASAWLRMTRGQWMDEPECWRTIAPADHAKHWEATSRAKLALGNAAAPLAAIVAGDVDNVEALHALHEDFSLVSQVMNDLGDLQGWAGFHVLAPCRRGARAEASRKPTIATIWGDRARAEHAVEQMTSVALERLERLRLAPAAKALLADFFSAPLAQLRLAVAR
jgi:geranylgeranyl diphosphate synthase, type I